MQEIKIKHLFNSFFPYDLEFKKKFFLLLEERKEDKILLDILSELLELANKKKEAEKYQIVQNLTQELKTRGIDLKIQSIPHKS